MKKLFFSLVFMLLPFLAMAQQNVLAFKFVYFSYDKVLHVIADYTTAICNYNDLKAKYDAETKRSVEDFNSRYEGSLDVQCKLESSTPRKRQAELEELMDRNIAFRKESGRLLKKTEEDICAPVHARLNNAVHQMGKESGYVFTLDVDNNSAPLANTAMGEDIIETLIAALK